MRLKNSNILALLPLLVVAGCGSFDGRSDAGEAGARPESLPPAPASNEDIVKIGQPYEAGGQTYTPVDQASYDEVGYASWYGNELSGNKTGNGEAFNPEAITGAHRTLPMPSYVEVTNLDTGRTILVRINDRGPFARDRIIDLSQGAARQLGVDGQGHFPVRVRRVNPPEHEKIALRNGEKAAERLETPPALLNALRKRLGTTSIAAANPALAAADAATGVGKPSKPVSKPARKPQAGATFDQPKAGPTPAQAGDRFVVEDAANPSRATPRPRLAPAATSGAYYVQVGAFSTEERANAAAKQVGGGVQPAGKFWRVRTGPYPSEAAAKAALGPVAAKGYRDARITR